MHENIDRILLRANNLLVHEYHKPKASKARKQAVVAAYARLNQGKSIQDAPAQGIPLPMDPDGSETVSAAHFAAQALGMKVVEYGGLENRDHIGKEHLVIWRYVEGEQGASGPDLRSKMRQAGMCIHIPIGGAQQMVSFGQKVSQRRDAVGEPDPTQPSFF